MNHHLGYESNDKGEKENINRRNGYGSKNLKTSKGSLNIEVPRDRDASFTPQLIPKGKKDISAMEDKIIKMYARGMSQRDIAKTIEELYNFSISHEMVSKITDTIIPELEQWQNRPLQSCYPFIFVDCMYVSIQSIKESKKHAVYSILAYDLNGQKDILGLWIHESESKHQWMQIFDEIKARGVEDIFFLSMDGVSGLEEGASAIFPDVIVQRCIVHLIRNSMRYIPSKHYKKYTQALKEVYSAPSLERAKAIFDSFCIAWNDYPGAIDVWVRNFRYVEQLFNYGSAVRKVMYTTNAIEAVHSSFRKVTKKGAFPNEKSLLKILYLRILELYDKWKDGKIRNWAMVMNQLIIHEQFALKIHKHIRL